MTLNNPTPGAGAFFGAVAGGVGDVSGDNVPDLLVTAVKQNRAFVFSGADGSLLLTLTNPTPQALANFGVDAAGVGDVSGDNVPDLLVAASEQDVGGNADQGRAFVFSGADGSLLLTLDNPTPQGNAFFGRTMAGVGDVSGDNVPDFLVAADGQDVGGNTNQGQAFVFSGADGSLLLTLDNPNPQAGTSFGGAVAGAGDVNGDNVPDLLVAADGQDVGGNGDQGRAFLFVSMLIEETVDIKPGSDPNSINCNNEQEVITVAILTTEDLDATTVDHTTVTFEGASEIHVDGTGPVRRHEEDVDGDGDTDLAFHFRLGDTNLTCNSTEGSLMGETFDGQAIEGTDSVSMIGE